MIATSRLSGDGQHNFVYIIIMLEGIDEILVDVAALMTGTRFRL